MKAVKGISDKKAVQQDLVNTARKELRQQGIPEFECSILESSNNKAQCNVEEKKKRGSGKEKPGSNTSCKRGGKSPQGSRKNDQPPPKKPRRESFSRQERGNPRRSSALRQWKRSSLTYVLFGGTVRRATFFLVKLFSQATVYLAELFRQITSPFLIN